ncbi:cation transporter [Pseudomonas sp. A2]|uniref:cation diffusion facilitator family transporter n=1 Tax=Pseudomonas sp. A2 TaxID=107445 RepID=UPI0020005147|nr:cation transporter [Pseudomonas sp. A2]UPK87474.1 cation transporter [Pseudomonas sp. A2]
MQTPTRSSFFDITSEQGLLRTSIAVTLFIAVIGIAFGLASGSFSIVFDGVYSLVDASMSGLSLVVVRLITAHTTSVQMSRKLRERFTMVLALNGILLSGVAIYALINAVSSLLQGGRHLEFGIAMVYAVLTVIACVTIAAVEARANRKLGSDFVRMDVKGWVMSASITAALLIAFCFGYAVQGTSLEWVSPYIDPAVLALVCLVIVPLPMSVVRQAMSEIFLVTPGDLKLHVDEVAKAFVARHGLQSYRAYVAKVGRSREIELYFIVPKAMAAKTIDEWDAWRNEIGDAVGGEGPDRWLTVVFTGDPEWAE